MMNSLSHSHDFIPVTQAQSEKRIGAVVLLTTAMTFIEVVAGSYYNSSALTADGWHMSTHAIALGVSLFAYRFARTNRTNPHFSFGTGKINALGSFASAVILALVAVYIFVDALTGLITPRAIQYNEAIIVAFVSLAVNAASIFLLKEDHHGHDHDHDHHEDHNLRAAYLHVIADTLTSALAIAALFLAKYLGWHWADSLAGIVGAIIVGQWAFKLIATTAPLLLDKHSQNIDVLNLKNLFESDGITKVSDIHIWNLTATATACILSLSTNDKSITVENCKTRLADFGFKHITIEVNYE